MKDKYNHIDFDELLLNKTFDELSLEEKEFVHNGIGSREDYEDMRTVLLNIQNSDVDVLTPADSVKESLLEQFDKTRRGTIRELIRMPAFQIGIAASLFIGAFLIIRGSGGEENLRVAEVCHVVDTLKFNRDVAPIQDTGITEHEEIKVVDLKELPEHNYIAEHEETFNKNKKDTTTKLPINEEEAPVKLAVYERSHEKKGVSLQDEELLASVLFTAL